jgi:selenocysteine lyase/cysteine desulfurase
MGDVNELFEQHGIYLNTATFGLPPKPAHDAMVAALSDWRTGRTGEYDWEADTERARATFGRIVNVAPENIAVGATVSELIGLIAAALPDGAQVLTAERDFASTIFPFTVHEHRGVVVRAVPLEELAQSLTPNDAIVVVSQVQAQSGAVVDLDAVIAAAARTGTLVCIDGTQACGWLPTDASRVDFYICHAYKWLLAPRGAAFLTVRPNRLASIAPLHAGWYATDDPNNNLFGLPNRLSKTARRLDTSPAWFSWVGTARSLAILEEISIVRIHDHDMRLAARFCDALGLPPPVSPIVYVEADGAFDRLMNAGIRASVRAGRMRASFHIYNTDDHVDAAVEALAKASAV